MCTRPSKIAGEEDDRCLKKRKRISKTDGAIEWNGPAVGCKVYSGGANGGPRVIHSGKGSEREVAEQSSIRRKSGFIRSVEMDTQDLEFVSLMVGDGALSFFGCLTGTKPQSNEG